jgi:V/A-type H+-transporting ATPase subunit A
MLEVARIGGEPQAKLLGEVVRIREKEVDIQVYGDTTGLAAGGEVFFTGELLSVDLGPGLLGKVLDGTGRPLRAGKPAEEGTPERPWHFTPSAVEGNRIAPGDVLGTVGEGKSFLHRILVPPALPSQETVAWIAPEGDYDSRETVCRLAGGTELTLTQRWEVRVPRPVKARLPLDRPLLTGMRLLDTLFPLALGGVAAMPGGTGTGKTVVQRSLAKGCNADVIVYVGCGCRGAEIAGALEEFSEAGEARRQGIPLRERTVFVANTSNMPMAAREPAIHLGMTLAEYYRDMGCDAVLIIDSMSRWAEALREIGSRLEESPGEGGYPAYLGSRLAGYCERAGQVETLGSLNSPDSFFRRGSVTLVNVFSPEGGDFSEPVTQAGLSPAGACWRLDAGLAQARRFPAIDLDGSYSFYEEAVSDAWAREAGQDWPELKEYLRNILLRRRELSDSACSAGAALSEEDRWLLFHAETLKTVYLRQNALDAKDDCPSPARWAAMLRLLKTLDDKVRKLLSEGLSCDDVTGVPMRPELTALRLSADFTDEGREWLALFSDRLTIELTAKRLADQEVER